MNMLAFMCKIFISIGMIVHSNPEGVMATSQWKCETCGFIGQQDKFEVNNGIINEHICPIEICGSDQIAPHRMFRCGECTFEADQTEFFGEFNARRKSCTIPLDPDPTKANPPWTRECVARRPETGIVCQSEKWEQIL
jgi:hypothetical protein